ncbi:Cdc25 phosphatase Ibp1 [Tilletia horrida]|nr:Cdc25 phosphatase Ibp1 [Tilletia horrida]
MSFHPPYTYIDAPSLAERVKAGDVSRKELAIVDVRDDDFVGGSIVGAKNVPSSSFEQRVDSLVKDLVDVPKVVFHCHLSQQRGPKAARIYSDARKEAIASGALPAGPNQTQQVVVLRDGAAGFVRQYKDNGQLVQDYDAESWAYRE